MNYEYELRIWATNMSYEYELRIWRTNMTYEYDVRIWRTNSLQVNMILFVRLMLLHVYALFVTTRKHSLQTKDGCHGDIYAYK